MSFEAKARKVEEEQEVCGAWCISLLLCFFSSPRSHVFMH
jgi:hypothetical protein